MNKLDVILLNSVLSFASRPNPTPVTLQSHGPKFNKIASVACILRLKSNGLKYESLTELVSSLVFDSASSSSAAPPAAIQLEVLLIKRAERKGDPWSGDFAFPGGHLETNETDREAVERETFEEIGVHLNDATKYKHCGVLEPRVMRTKRGTILVVPHLYIDMQRALMREHDSNTCSNNISDNIITTENSRSFHDTNPTSNGDDDDYSEFTLNRDEVDHVRWIPVNDLYKEISGTGFHNFNRITHNNTTLKLSVYDLFLKPLSTQKIRQIVVYWLLRCVVFLLNIRHIVLPCVYLPRQQPVVNNNSSSDGMNVQAESANNRDHSSTTLSRRTNSNRPGNNSVGDTANGGNSGSISNGNTNNNSKNRSDKAPESSQETHPLWGLTYGVLCDLFALPYYRKENKQATATSTVGTDTSNTTTENPATDSNVSTTMARNIKLNFVRHKLFLSDNPLLNRVILWIDWFSRGMFKTRTVTRRYQRIIIVSCTIYLLLKVVLIGFLLRFIWVVLMRSK